MWRSYVWIKENEEEVATVSMVMVAAMGDGESSEGMKMVAERGSSAVEISRSDVVEGIATVMVAKGWLLWWHW